MARTKPGEFEREHIPQAFLKRFGVDVFQHLVLADDQMRRNHFADVGAVELSAADIGQHYAMAVGEGWLALLRSTRKDQLRIALKPIGDGEHVIARLP